MEKQIPVTSAKPKVVVEVYGDLSLKGWEHSLVSAECASSEDLELVDRHEEVYLRCRDNCTVQVPYGSNLQIKRAEGNTSIKSLEGALEIERVGGHLSLRSVGGTRVKQVDGHLSAKNVSGELRLERVSGHASVRDIQGDFRVEAIDGNLQLEELDGNGSARVHGNARLNLDPSPGQRITCEADGNLVCRVPQDASAQVVVERASSLRVKLPGAEAKNLSTPYQIALGEGAAEIHLKAGGSLVISQLPPEFGFASGAGFGFDELSASIEQQVEQQLETQLEMIDQQMEDLSVMLASAGLLPEQAEQIQRRARQANERAAARAQEKMRRAQEKMQRKVEAASRRAAMKAAAAERAARDRRRRPESVEPAPAAAARTAEPVSEQERLVVLKMLETQQITPEQAEQLLAALEGRSG